MKCMNSSTIVGSRLRFLRTWTTRTNISEKPSMLYGMSLTFGRLFDIVVMFHPIPRWTVCPPPRGRAQTIADPQPLHRVPTLYPRYIRNDQKDRLSAMILGSTVLGWACAMRCFPISTGSSNWLSRSPIWMAMKGSLSLDEPSRLYTGQILIFQVPDHWNWHIQISFQVQCLVSCWSKLRTSTHGCFEGV